MRYVSGLLTLFCLALVLFAHAQDEKSAKKRCYITQQSEWTELRAEPDPKAEETAKVRYGQMLVYESTGIKLGADEKKWYFVSDPYGEQQGWVPRALIGSKRPEPVDRGTFTGVAHTKDGVKFQPAAELALLQLNERGESYYRRKAKDIDKEEVEAGIRQLGELESKVVGNAEVDVEGVLPTREVREEKGAGYATKQ